MKRRPAKGSEKVVRMKRAVKAVGVTDAPTQSDFPPIGSSNHGCGVDQDAFMVSSAKKEQSRSGGWFTLMPTSSGGEMTPIFWLKKEPCLFYRIMFRVLLGLRWQRYDS